MYHTEKEKNEIKREEAFNKRYEEDRRRIEATEKAIKEDHEKTNRKYEEAREMRAYIREQKYKQDLKEKSDRKRENAYKKEVKELERLRRPAYVDKREPAGYVAGQIALQRQKETEILGAKTIKRETETTEAWRQSERDRMAKLTEDNQLNRLETEQHSKEFMEAVSFEIGLKKSKKSLMGLFKEQNY